MLLETDRNRLYHMAEAMAQAIEYSHRHDCGEVESGPPLQHLMVRNLEILGEAASRISPEFRDAHPEIPWRDMVDMRNRLIHAYFDIDMDIVWGTVRRALPPVLEAVQNVLGANADG